MSSAAVRRTASRVVGKLRGAAVQLREDVRAAHWREVAHEFKPNRLWRDFRQLDLRVQLGWAVTGYGVVATALMYTFLRHTQAARRRQMAEVYRSFQ
mmetsp:Transcript_25137/g.70870  ORF Transcript_25137/g.70870 Transcript_25137/m.70870 type:complete len:97 (+) Transcript_25137:97-387(+)